MHIVQLIPALRQGGVEAIVCGLAAEYARRGHCSTVISSGGPLVGRVEAGGSTHLRLEMASKNPLTVWPRARALGRLLRRLGPDVVHAHSRVPAWLYRLSRVRLPWVTTVHGFNSPNAYSAVMARGDRVTGVSRAVLAYAKEHFGLEEASARLIPCGIDLDFFDPDKVDHETLEALCAEHGLAGKRVVTTVGRITELKDYETFIEAVVRARREDPALHGLVCGSVSPNKRDYYERLQKRVDELQARPFITFLLDCPHLREVYALSDLVVSAKKEPEAFGLTLIEALAMNTPVLATRHGGPLDIIEEGRNGAFFAPGDVEGLARLLVNPLLPSEADHRARVVDRYSIEAMATGMLEVYAEVAPSRR